MTSETVNKWVIWLGLGLAVAVGALWLAGLFLKPDKDAQADQLMINPSASFWLSKTELAADMVKAQNGDGGAALALAHHYGFGGGGKMSFAEMEGQSKKWYRVAVKNGSKDAMREFAPVLVLDGECEELRALLARPEAADLKAGAQMKGCEKQAATH